MISGERLQDHWSSGINFVQSQNLIGCKGDIKVICCKTLKIYKRDELILCIHAFDIRFYIICLFVPMR